MCQWPSRPGARFIEFSLEVSHAGGANGRKSMEVMYPATDAHLRCWARLCPRNDESAGKRRSTRLRRTEGNLTGVAPFTASLGAKRVSLVRDLLPAATTVGFLVEPSYPAAEAQLEDMEEAAHAGGLQLVVVNVSGERDFDAAFGTLVQRKADALVLASDPFFTGLRDRLVALAVQYGIPTMYFQREFVAAGGLMSY